MEVPPGLPPPALAPPELGPALAEPLAAEPPDAAELLAALEVADDVVLEEAVVLVEGAATVPVGTVNSGAPEVFATVVVPPQALSRAAVQTTPSAPAAL